LRSSFAALRKTGGGGSLGEAPGKKGMRQERGLEVKARFMTPLERSL
jgi:hypothetical protein